MSAFPADVTFVDEGDSVRYYSEGYRIFTHPPGSRSRVAQLISELKSGWQGRDDAVRPLSSGR